MENRTAKKLQDIQMRSQCIDFALKSGLSGLDNILSASEKFYEFVNKDEIKNDSNK